MALRFYNTLTRKKEVFKPVKSGEVSIYSCGPTVYNYVHIGNLRAYIFVDLLKRYLKYKGFKLKDVMNITDVDDKTIRDSKKENKSLKDFTEFYTKAFLDDLKTLNIQLPSIMPKATESIKEMISIIRKLDNNHHTYEKNGNIYFRISSFKDYGKLANLDPKALKKNADGRLNTSDEYEKEDARDFALWKAYEDSDGKVFWDTEYGKGRPGWHIECSAMSQKYLGDHFDIHTGGVDLIFPHHTNEIAQSECANKEKFVNFWLHNAHLIVNGEKMSKSLGNFFTLRDLIKKGYDPKAIRYELLSTHYRQQLDFREDNLKKLPETIQKFYDFLDNLDAIIKNKPKIEDNKGLSKMIDSAKKGFESALDDDLNISEALGAVFTFMREINKNIDALSAKDAKKVKDIMLGFDSVLGVMERKKESIPKEILSIAEEREKARKAKDFRKADDLRDKISAKGYEIKDTKEGYILRKKN